MVLYHARSKLSRCLQLWVNLMKIHYNSPVILTYAIICLAILLLDTMVTGHAITTTYFAIFRTSMLDPLLYFRLFSYVFGHIDFNHYFGNLTMLLLIGPMIEEKYGSKALLLMMTVTALIGSISHVLLFSAGALGASGIVFMLILLTPFTNMKKGKIPLTFILVALVFIGREIIYSFTVVDNVSRFGHIIGGASGAIMGFYRAQTRVNRK